MPSLDVIASDVLSVFPRAESHRNQKENPNLNMPKQIKYLFASSNIYSQVSEGLNHFYWMSESSRGFWLKP